MSNTTAATIRNQVTNLINANKTETQILQAASLTGDTKQNNSRLLRACLAFDRAHETKSAAHLTDTHKKDYAAAIRIIANQTNHANHSTADLLTNITPEYAVKFFAAATKQAYQATNSTNWASEAQTQIQQDISEIYPDDSIDIPAYIKDLPNQSPEQPSLPAIFENREETTVNEQLYDQTPSTTVNQNNFPEETFDIDDDQEDKLTRQVKENINDPDWGHKKDDDDFKIQDGDIIDYLMKEIILKSTAKAGNFVAGMGGSIIYEFARGTVRHGIRPLGRAAKNKIAGTFQNLSSPGTGNGNTNGTPTRPGSANDELDFNNLRQRLGLTQNYDNVETCLAKLKELPSKQKELNGMLRLMSYIQTNSIVFDDNKQEIIYKGGKPTPYSNIANIDMLKKNLADSNDETLKKLKEYFPGQENKVEDFYQRYITEEKNKIRSSKKVQATTPEDKKFEKKLLNIRAQNVINVYKEERISEHNLALNTFMALYARAEVLKEFQKQPNLSPKQLEKLQKEAKLRGANLFLNIENHIRTGQTKINNQDIPSTAKLIKMAQQYDHEVNEAHNQSTPMPENPFTIYTDTNATLKEVKKDTKEKASLIEAALQNGSSESFDMELNALKTLEHDQIVQQDFISQRRLRLKEFQKSLNGLASQPQQTTSKPNTKATGGRE